MKMGVLEICVMFIGVSLSSVSNADALIEKPLIPDDILRVAVVQVGSRDLNIPLPPIYPIQTVINKRGPDGSWHQLTFEPEKHLAPAWDEMISVLILPSNLPPRPTPSRAALQVIEAGVARECSEKIVTEVADAPKFKIKQGEVSSITIKCKSISKNKETPYLGYHVAINNGNSIFVLSRTAIEREVGGLATLPNNWPRTWQDGFINFGVCAVGEVCVLSSPASSSP